MTKMGCCFCEEYFKSYDNQYYHMLGSKTGIYSRIVAETENWYAVPTIGCITVGYILLICKQHYQSLANVGWKLYQEMLYLKNSVEEILSNKLGMPCLAFEHGNTDFGFVGANSVDHVHLHIVPLSKVVWNDFCQKYDMKGFECITDYESLFKKWQDNLPQTYLLFQDVNQIIYYKPDAEKVPSQFFRKCLASYSGISEWDWRKEFYSENFLKTLELFH